MGSKLKSKIPANYIAPLFMNGLQGRMLRMPPPRGKKAEFLIVYGHHGSLERCFGLAESFNEFGGVTVPDLPGFGGMKSFYRIGEKPDLDTLADYLAAFVKLRYRRSRLSIGGHSFGFLVVTRMLQKHPDIAKRVDILISITGFTRNDEFNLSPSKKFLYRSIARFFCRKLPSVFFRNVMLHPSIIKFYYARTSSGKAKLRGLSNEEREKILQNEVRSWRSSDVRTYMMTIITMFSVDNCTQSVDAPVWHVMVNDDDYLNNQIVEQHMQVIFRSYQKIPTKMTRHSLGFIGDKKTASPLMPSQLRTMLRSAT